MGCGCGRTTSSISSNTSNLTSELDSQSPVLNRLYSSNNSGVPVPPTQSTENLELNSKNQTPVYTQESNSVVTPNTSEEKTSFLERLANNQPTEKIGLGIRRLAGLPLLRKSNDSIADSGIPVVQASNKPYNLINVIKDTITGDVKYSIEEKAKTRQAICDSCPNQMAGACTKCGCIIKLKVKYEESSCPIGKW